MAGSGAWSLRGHVGLWRDDHSPGLLALDVHDVDLEAE